MSAEAEKAPKEKRLPTPLVLALVSAMLCAGLVGMLWNVGSEPEIQVDELPTPVDVDDRTPEAAAETFLDAWRKRDHAVAETLAIGDALDQVRSRRDRDGVGADPQLEKIWNEMAANRLEFAVDTAENLEGGDMRLIGVAEGTFLSQPYAREVAFEMHETPDGWRVQSIVFGEVLEGAHR
ncbi:MAG: hypothetical protein JJ863_28100 [Deltaproteobacteria bacterium]|nr:hypothetical protein [Deltaproteobacteria bacterium]